MNKAALYLYCPDGQGVQWEDGDLNEISLFKQRTGAKKKKPNLKIILIKTKPHSFCTIPLPQAADRESLSFRVWRSRSCYALILTAAFATASVRCQCLLALHPHPPAALSNESAPDACRLGSLSFINCKSLQLHRLQELLRATPAGSLPL